MCTTFPSSSPPRAAALVAAALFGLIWWPAAAAAADLSSGRGLLEQSLQEGQRQGYDLDRDAAFPSVGAIFERDNGGWLTLRCSGVLLQPDVVVTAAHCLLRGRANGPLQAERFVFVPSASAAPTAMKRTHLGRAVAFHPDFVAERLGRIPLFYRRTQSTAEEVALASLEAACGQRDVVASQQDWLRCVTDQSGELQAALGIRGRGGSDFDVALLFLAPGAVGSAAASPEYVDKSATQARLLEKHRVHGHTPLEKADRLLVAGFGLAAEDAWLFSWLKPKYTKLFEPHRRQWLEGAAQRRDGQEFVLQSGARTCAGASGAGVFTRRTDGSYRLVGLLTRRAAPWHDDACGDYATVIEMAPLLAWARDRMLQEPCQIGERTPGGCEQAEEPVSGPAKMDE